MLFGLSFILLQMCIVQMSAQAFASDHHATAAIHTAETTNPHQQSDSNRHHDKDSAACSVSGCMAPLPKPLIMEKPAVFAREKLVLVQKTLLGLPPVLSERPPKSVFA